MEKTDEKPAARRSLRAVVQRCLFVVGVTCFVAGLTTAIYFGVQAPKYMGSFEHYADFHACIGLGTLAAVGGLTIAKVCVLFGSWINR